MLHSSSSGIIMTRSTRLSVSPLANDKSSEPVALKINSPMGITKNIPESSYGTVKNKLTAAGKRDNDVLADVN